MSSIKLYDGNVELEFDPKRHMYKANGVYVPNVTKVLSVIAKPALIGWAAKVTSEYILKMWKPGVVYNREQINAITHDAKSARYKISKKALDIGSQAHDWIESWVKAEIFQIEKPDMPEHPKVLSCVESFLSWVSSHEITWYYSERKIFSRAYMYSGTVDGFWDIDGVLTSVDIKTSTGIYPEYFLQCAAYAKAIEEETGMVSEAIGVLRVPKDGEDVEYESRSDIDELFEAFLAALKLWSWQQEFK